LQQVEYPIFSYSLYLYLYLFFGIMIA